MITSIVVSVLFVAVFLYGRHSYKKLMAKFDDLHVEIIRTPTELWDARLATTIEQLTSEDTLAEALSKMSDEQLARLAERTQRFRKERAE